MAEEEGKNPMEWPREATEASDFDFMMVGKDSNPIMKIKKQKLNEIIVVQGESMPAIQGGATSAAAITLPAGPTGQNRWFDASWGYWKYNNVVLKNPLGTDGIPQGNDGTLYWDGTALTWKISKMQLLPTTPVANAFGSSTTEAISQAKASELNEAINKQGAPAYTVGTPNLSDQATTTSAGFIFLSNLNGVTNNSKAIEFAIRCNVAGSVTLIQFRPNASNGLTEIDRKTFTAVVGGNIFTIDMPVLVGDKFGVIGGGVSYGGTGGGGYFSVNASRNPAYFTQSELTTPTSSYWINYNVKIAKIESGISQQVVDLTANKAEKSLVVEKNDVVTEVGKNKFDKATMILPNKLVDNAGNLATVNGAKASRTPALPNTQYSFQLSKYIANSGGVIRFVRADFSLISFLISDNFAASDSGLGKKFTTPAETAFIENNILYSTTGFTDMTNTFQLELGPSVTAYEPYGKIATSILGAKIQASAEQSKIVHIDKRILFLGDSITASLNYDYVARILTHISFKSVTRLARSGATWTNTVDTVYDVTSTGGSTTPDNVIWNQFNRMKKRIVDGIDQVPDVVYISCGTNDYGRPKGDVSSAFNGSIVDKAANQVLTLTESVRWNIELILKEWPNVQIILATPIQRGLADNSIIFDIGDKIEACAKRMSNPVIRQDFIIGINGYLESIEAKDLYDKLHPNGPGSNKMGDGVATQLLHIIAA